MKPISSCALTACFSCSGKSSTNCYHLVTRFLTDFCKLPAKVIPTVLSKLLQAGCHLVTMLMTVTDLLVKLFQQGYLQAVRNRLDCYKIGVELVTYSFWEELVTSLSN